MEKTSILDVTVIEPRLKHPTIFEKYDDLNPGEAFIIHNDHDPKPLYYQLLAERGQTFEWDYLTSGPLVWEVKISKKTLQANEETIGEMVTKDYRKAQVFKKFGIDFCCGGKKTVTEVCDKKGLDKALVLKELESLSGKVETGANDYLKWDIGFLADYIKNTHHQYIKENTSFITELAIKVAKVHGAEHPELIDVANTFSAVANDLLLHLAKEEKVLFPAIKEIAVAKLNGSKLSVNEFGKISGPINLMESEHEQAGESLEGIRQLTNNFELPADACNSYTILFKKLEEYENDLHQHVHLENNILFPKAIAMEKECFQN